MSQQQNPPGINPKWNTLLSKIPPEFHNQIIPDLQEWDRGVQQRFTEIKSEYAEYEKFKPLVENNIDYDYVAQAVTLADELQRDAPKVISQINEAWNLGFVSKEDAEKLGQSAGDSTDKDDFFNEGDDILKHPQVKAMQEALEQLQQTYESDKTAQQQQEEEDARIAKFESDLDALEKKYTQPEDGSDPQPFNRLFVTALMAQDIDGDEAVRQYHQAIAATIPPASNSDENTNPGSNGAPVVMGNGGTAGSGSSDGSVDYGKMNTSDFNDTVEQLLEQSLRNNQG